MDSKTAYDVAVEEGGLNWEQAGPLFDRYAVTLIGRIDRRWVDCYQRITVSMPAYSRFRLEPAVSSITFTCRSTDGPVDVMRVFKRLEELLTQVNREATAEAAARPAEAPLAAHPAPAASAPAPKGPTSIAADLLSRFSRR